MTARTAIEYLLGGLLILIVGSLLVGQLLGQPVLIGYVETGSMSPTMEPNDGYIAIPPQLAGPIEEGDVVTFDAKVLHGGGLTTHRVVGQTDEGYITKGDANPFPDQDAKEPPVPPDRVKAVALELGGDPLVLPQIGLLVTGVSGALSWLQQQLAILFGTRALLGTQGLAYILFGIGVLAYLGSELLASANPRRATRSRHRATGTIDGRQVTLTLTFLLVVLVTASMVIPAGTTTRTIVSSESDAPGPDVIHKGGSENLTYVVPSNGLVPVVAYLEPASDGVAVSPTVVSVPGNSERNVTITLSAPPQTGAYERSFTEHRYLALLPQATLDALYEVHPWLPIAVIDLLLGLGFAGFTSAVLGAGPIRIESRSRVPLRTRVRRWLK